MRGAGRLYLLHIVLAALGLALLGGSVALILARQSFDGRPRRRPLGAAALTAGPQRDRQFLEELLGGIAVVLDVDADESDLPFVRRRRLAEEAPPMPSAGMAIGGRGGPVDRRDAF